MANNQDRKGTASVSTIVAHWKNSGVKDRDGYLYFSSVKKNQCMGCGVITAVQRAHIKPKNEGGPDTADNLHMLCTFCHNESEFLSGDTYWDWIFSIGFFTHCNARCRAAGIDWDKVIQLPENKQKKVRDAMEKNAHRPMSEIITLLDKSGINIKS